MDSQQIEKLLAEQNTLARQTKAHLRYMTAALVLIAAALIVTMVLAWKTYSENVAPALGGMQTTMAEVHETAVQTQALLQEAKQTMVDVRRATGAVVPMVGQAQQTIQQAQETTQQVQAPLNFLRSIPIVNWFMY